MDHEPLGMSAATLDHHLVVCADCARWVEQAARLTRQLRLGAADVPDLGDAITAGVVLPARRVLRRRWVFRLGLLVVGLVQLAIAVPALGGTDIGMAMSTHASHEAAAWNLALAAAFLATASSPRRAAGLVPLLATFVTVLLALSVRDYAAGVVALDRIATHAAAVVGLLLVLALDRAERALPPGRFTTSRGGRDSDEHGQHRGLKGVA